MEDETERMRAELLKKEAELIKLKQMQLDMQILQLKKEMPGQVLMITFYLSNRPEKTVTNIEIKTSCLSPVVISLTFQHIKRGELNSLDVLTLLTYIICEVDFGT